jgi:hypothetical protein
VSPAQKAGEDTQHACGSEEQRGEDWRTVHDVVKKMLRAAWSTKHAARMVIEADSRIGACDY